MYRKRRCVCGFSIVFVRTRWVIVAEMHCLWQWRVNHFCKLFSHQSNYVKYWWQHPIIGHHRWSRLELVAETVGAVWIVETRLRIDMTSVIISEINRFVRANIWYQIIRLLGRRWPIKHWERRIIAGVAVLFEHSVTQSSPFSYKQFACQLKWKCYCKSYLFNVKI